MQHNNPERGFLHRCWDLKERYESLDSLDVSIHEVDIPLLFFFFFTLLIKFAESVLVLLSLLQLREYSYFEKGCRKNCVRDNPKGNMAYAQYTVPDTVAVESTFVAFL